MPQPLGEIVYLAPEADTGLTVNYKMFDEVVTQVAQGVLVEASPGIYTEAMPEAAPGEAFPAGIYIFRFYDDATGNEIGEQGVLYWNGKAEVDMLSLDALSESNFALIDAIDLSNLDVAVSTRATNAGVDSILAADFASLATLIGALNDISIAEIEAANIGITTAEVRAEVDAGLVAYDGPTTAEMDAAFLLIMGGGFDTLTDSLEAIRNRGDEAWVGGTVVDPPGGQLPTTTDAEAAYAAITTAINEGALEVQYADKKVKYHSLVEMLAIQRRLAGEIGLGGGGGRKYGQHSKNLDGNGSTEA